MTRSTSQDSQAYLEAYRAEFGVGMIDSWPSVSKLCLSRGNGTSQDQSQPIDPSKSTNTNHNKNSVDADAVENDVHRLSESEPRLRPATEKKQSYNQETTMTDVTNQSDSYTRSSCAITNAPGDDLISLPANLRPADGDDAFASSLHDNFEPPPVPIAGLAPPPLLNNMDISQQTPTQVNDDRDYTEYRDFLPPSSGNGSGATTQLLSTGPRTLLEDDTGVVNFGNLADLGRPSSQVSEDAGFENTRSEWRLPADDTSQPQPHSLTTHTPRRPRDNAFETPAPFKNPFSTRNDSTAPFVASQLFGQSQFSSAIKKLSPTSSRPTPHVPKFSTLPNIETSPLMNRANVSPITDIRTSSPPGADEIIDTQPPGVEGGQEEAEVIPESPQSTQDAAISYEQPRSSGNGPITHYIPMKKSQEKKTSDGLLPAYVASDSDSDDATRRIERRKRVEKKRAKAAQELERVNFVPRARSDSLEQPGRKRRRVMSNVTTNTMRSNVQAYPEQPRIEELPPLVRDSQNKTQGSSSTAQDSTKATPRDMQPRNKEIDGDGDIEMPNGTAKSFSIEDMIPATSPSGSGQPGDQQAPGEPDLPSLVMEDPQHLEDVVKDKPASSVPMMKHRRVKQTYSRSVRQRRYNRVISSSDVPMADPTPREEPSSPSMPDTGPSTMIEETRLEPEGEADTEDVDSGNMNDGEGNNGDREEPQRDEKPDLEVPQPLQKQYAALPPPMSTRSRRRETAPTTPVTTRASLALAVPTSSSLSTLTTTPVASSDTTPITQDSPSNIREESVTLPTPQKMSRRKTLSTSTRSESPQTAARVRRLLGRRGHRLDSDSTDDLAHSPPGSALEKSVVHNSKSSRSFRQSLGPIHRVGRLFEGMVFAISFQPGPTKQNERTMLEKKVALAGGLILSDGFQELFEHPRIMDTATPLMDDEDPLKLTKSSVDCGFTALIVDSHSRKAKYMQALALGIPCLAYQWITACISKEAVVDWEPYLLCAGVSAVLGNAIRSRNLSPYYAAVDARLAHIIEQRPLLLQNNRILVVLDARKSRSAAKEPYIFLAKALGPSISRVFTTLQAREALVAQEAAGRPFDWLYVDKGTSTVDAVLAPADSKGGKKRKMKGWAMPKLVSISVLDDELVIQSLIMGRMVEGDEIAP